eukprot:1868334-Pyramimonas_sp.AAC.1
MRQCASGADEHVCNHLGCLGVGVGDCKYRMLYMTERFDVFVLVQRDTAVLILGIYHGTIGACVHVGFALPKGVLHALDAL